MEWLLSFNRKGHAVCHGTQPVPYQACPEFLPRDLHTFYNAADTRQPSFAF
jgi:hypothetical protein